MKAEHYILACDIETGGKVFTEHPITQIAIISLDPELKEVERYESYIKPYNKLVITQDALDYTGLKLIDIENGPESKKVVKELIEIFKKYRIGKYNKPIFCGHNFSKFDIKFLVALFKLHSEDIFDYIEEFILDTLLWGRLKYGQDEDNENYQLSTIAGKMGVEYSDGHSAMNDTEVQAGLAKAIVNEWRTGEVVVTNSDKQRARVEFKF